MKSGSDPDFSELGSDPELELQALDGFPVDEFLEIGVVREFDLAAADLRAQARDLGFEEHEERMRRGDAARVFHGGGVLEGDQRAQGAFVIHRDRKARVAAGSDVFDRARFGEADARGLRRERARAASGIEARVVGRSAREIDEDRQAADTLQRRVASVGRKRARVLGHGDARVGERAHIFERFLARVASIRLDHELYRVADCGAHLGEHARIGLPALPALEIERAHAVPVAGFGGLRGHARGTLARHHPAHLDLAAAAPERPQRHALRRGAQRPAGVVDQRLGEPVLGNPRQRRGYRFRVGKVDLAKLGQNDVLERDGERARRIPGACGLDHALGDARGAAVGHDLEQHIIAAVLGRVHPLDVPDIRQPVEMQRPLAELHAPYSERNGFLAPGQRNASRARSNRMRIPLALAFAAVLAGCGVTAPYRQDRGAAQPEPVAVVASALEPAAQLQGGRASYDGAMIGATGGAGLGAMSAYSSAGILCTIGGPLCMMIVVPVAVVGGLVGGVAGAAVDAVTADPFGRVAGARGTIDQALAEMRFTDGLASRASDQLKLPLAKAGEVPGDTFLEVEVSELEIMEHEKEMALVLRARSRLYRSADGKVLDEHVAETRTDFRKYRDWAADGAQPLRTAVDEALVRLGRDLVSARQQSRLRADTASRQDG